MSCDTGRRPEAIVERSAGSDGAGAWRRHALSQFSDGLRAAAELEKQQLRTIGLSVTVQDRILADFQKVSRSAALPARRRPIPTRRPRFSSGSSDYDCWEVIGERLPAVIVTDKIEPIAAASMKNWQNVRDTFTKVNPQMGAPGPDCRPNLEGRGGDRSMDGARPSITTTHRL